MAHLDFDGLKKLGIVLKRAQYFITCKGKAMPYVTIDKQHATLMLTSDSAKDNFKITAEETSQLSFFDMPQLNDRFIHKQNERMVINV